ncbi:MULTISPECIES: VgrG-related protein [unclassified Coleofasciculus]|uniref:VgrG-related protein n=1 Tax=unclassified Coleofasciculus TaxID=2692782 RepID=UPI001881FE82|nr:MULTISPECIES: VgrG-related protein [unclassified Coleofasciculus]MBE9126977.1 VgrG-related protein [Coleofasciculus sp. LEGE 07081]MBE9150340.1 VgrG-related protein [Coleofasciculus sp. LEGE 07092]
MPPVTYVAEPILDIDGQLASKALLDDILEIAVDESLHLPGMFTLVIKNDYSPGRTEDLMWRHAGLFEIGTSIKIGFSSSTTEAQEFEEEDRGYVIQGEITAMECNFTSDSQAPMIIRGYDISHRLWRGHYNRSFQNMTDTDIVNKIAGEVGIPTGKIDQTGGPYGYGDINGSNGYVFQENQTNLEFLRERAARNGFELFVQDGKLNFRKPNVDESLELKWLKEVHSFQVRVSSAEQMSDVEIRGWDYSQKQPIVETASNGQVFTTTDYGKGSQTSTSFKGKPPTPKLIVVDQPVFNAPEAKTMAQAACNELVGEFVQADATAQGNPKVRPGRVVKLKDLGKYSGEYYVTETRHLFNERVYTTEFTVRGLRGDNLPPILSHKAPFQPGQTLLVGIVTDNNDPNGWGRVRVKFPTLTEEHASYWARVVATGAGSSRGLDCLPEINDEVLVAFEHGDIHHPYVIGGVWNGKDKPPEPVTNTVMDGKVRLRTLKTRTGHTLQFVEEDKGGSKKGVYLDTVYDHHLYLNDTEQFIEAKTKNGHYLRLDDKNKKAEVKSQGGLYVLLDDGGKKIEIKSGVATITMKQTTGEINIRAGTKLTIDAGQIDITAPGIVNVKGSLIKLN